MSDANEILNIASDTLRSWMQGNLAYDDNTELSIGSGNALTSPTTDASNVSGWGTGNDGDRADINAVNNTDKVLSSDTSKNTQQLRSSEIERTIGVMVNRESGGLSTENQRSYLIDLLNAAMQYGNTEYSYSALNNMLYAVQNGYSGRSLSSMLTGNISSGVTYAPSKLALSADSSIDAMDARADEIERTLSKIQSLESSGAGTTDQREYLYQVIAAALKYGITGYTDKRLNDIRAGLNYGQSGDVLASYHSGKNKEELAVILEDETILTKSDVNMLKSNFSMMADVVNSAKGFVKATMAGLDNMFSINRYAPVVAGGNTYSFRFNNVTRQDAQYIETSITNMLENVDSDGGK